MYHIMRDEITNEVLDNVIQIETNTDITIFTPNYTNKASSSVNDIECLICLEIIISTEPLLILDCCSKTVHLACIIDWYSKHPTNKTCFICNQSNTFCRDLVYTEDEETDNNYPELVNPDRIIEVSNTDLVTMRDNELNILTHRCKISSYIIGIIFVVLIIIISFAIIF